MTSEAEASFSIKLDDRQVLRIVEKEATRQAEIYNVNADDLGGDVILKLYHKDGRKSNEPSHQDNKAHADNHARPTLIDSVRSMQYPEAYIRRMVQSRAVTLWREQHRGPVPIEGDVSCRVAPELPLGIPPGIEDARKAVRIWFATGPREQLIWGGAATKRYVLVDARRRFANRIFDLDLESRAHSSHRKTRRVSFIEWFINFPKRDCELIPQGAGVSILQIWNGIAKLVTASLDRRPMGAQKIGDPDVSRVITELGGEISAATWRRNCHRGWPRIHCIDPQLTERFFGIPHGGTFGG